MPAGYPGLCDRGRLEPAGARRRRAGRGDPARARASATLRRGAGAPDQRRRRGARRTGRPLRARSWYRRINLSERYTRHHRRRASHEWRSLWRRDQGRARRSAGGRPEGNVHVLVERRHAAIRYRHCGAPEDLIFTEALLQGEAGDRDRDRRAPWTKITRAREATQPIKSRTGGSTFKNPPGHKSWQLIDAGGMRGFAIGAGARCRSCTAISSSTRAAPRRRRSRSWARPFGARVTRHVRHRSRMGDQAHRHSGGRCSMTRRDPADTTCRRADGRLVGRARSQPVAGEACAEALRRAGFQVTPDRCQARHRGGPRRT